LLEFKFQDSQIVDMQTSSIWDIDGIAIDGPLKGKQLNRLAFDEGVWFEWLAFHPETNLYK